VDRGFTRTKGGKGVCGFRGLVLKTIRKASGDPAKAAKRQRRHWNREAALERRENMVEI
jgi:hypothetical protein